VINKEVFEKFFNEQEGFHLRSERFYDDVLLVKTGIGSLSSYEDLMVQWLKAAFDAGVEASTK
jgi:hypothetical protein